MEVNSDSADNSVNLKKNNALTTRPLSDDISMSELELLANKKKLNKKSEDFSVKIEGVVEDELGAESTKKSSKRGPLSKPSKSSKPSIRKHKELSSSNSDTDILERQKEKEKKINKENKNDNIRREKSELLYKLSKIHEVAKSKNSDAGLFKLDMNFTLEEIKNEYERIRTNMENERMVKFCKQMLLMGVQGVEMMNTKFDPLGMDLVGWSESMGYSMENQDYDEVLSELYEKYKGQGKMSPEVKLLLMILGSAAMFTITKKISNMESSDNMLSGIINSFMGGKKQKAQPQSPPQFNNEQQQFNNEQQQFNNTQQSQFNNAQQPQFNNAQQPQQPQQYEHYGRSPQQYVNLPLAGDLHSDSSDDTPSKMRGPDKNFDTPDSIDIENIIKTMNEKKKTKSQSLLNKIEEIVSESEDITRNIQLKPKRGKAATKKTTKRGKGVVV